MKKYIIFLFIIFSQVCEAEEIKKTPDPFFFTRRLVAYNVVYVLPLITIRNCIYNAYLDQPDARVVSLLAECLLPYGMSQFRCLIRKNFNVYSQASIHMQALTALIGSFLGKKVMQVTKNYLSWEKRKEKSEHIENEGF